MTEFNHATAQMLRSLADYIDMAQGDVKLRLGVQFKLKNIPVVNIPVLPSSRFSSALGMWSAQEVLGIVRRYQKETGSTDGDDLVAMFSQAVEHFKALDKKP